MLPTWVLTFRVVCLGRALYNSKQCFHIIMSDEGSFDGIRLNWKTPAVMTPLVVGPSDLTSEYIGMGVDGQLLDEQVATDRGYAVTVNEGAVESSIPFAAKGGVRKVLEPFHLCMQLVLILKLFVNLFFYILCFHPQSFVMDNVYNELYTVKLTYEQVFVDQSGVGTRQNAVRQMASPPIARPPYSVNRKFAFGVF